jgi:hypothetical protein
MLFFFLLFLLFPPSRLRLLPVYHKRTGEAVLTIQPILPQFRLLSLSYFARLHSWINATEHIYQKKKKKRKRKEKKRKETGCKRSLQRPFKYVSLEEE